MTKIGLISDTHGFLDEAVFTHFRDCDQVWHAGDFGSAEVADRLKSFKPLVGVHGNIDDQAIRSLYPGQTLFTCEEVKVLIRHIGGSPPKYEGETKKELALHKPDLFICGHSHILKIMYDDRISCLYMNPGAAGRQGWHQVRTVIRFAIEGKEIKRAEVIELKPRNPGNA